MAACTPRRDHADVQHLVYGEDKLTRGSGLFVGENGVVCNHNFLPPEDAKTFQFLAGDYVIEVFATLVGSQRPLTLGTFKLHLAEQLAARLASERDVRAFFDWGPDSQRYLSHAHQRRDSKLIGRSPTETKP